MRILQFVALSVVLVAFSQASLAFQESQTGSSVDGVVVDGTVTSESGAGFDTTHQSAKPAQEGTEVRIPGLGSLGVLPKMDFGLELLYGAAATPKVAEPDDEDKALSTEGDDFRVRGTVKHRF